MKITGLTTKLRREVESLRKQHADVIAEFTRRNKEYGRLDQRRHDLEKEIANLENTANPDDRKKIRRLAEKKVEFDLVVKRFNGLSNADTMPVDELKSLLSLAAEVLPRALKSTEDHFVEKVLRAMRPYFQDDALALYTARSTTAGTHLARAVHWPYYFMNPSVDLAQAIVRRCDEILQGELDFNFDPKMSR